MAFIGSYSTKQPNPTEQILRGLGTGLATGLDKLAENKLREIERQRTMQGLTNIGFEEQEAKGLSQLPQDIQKELVKERATAEREALKTTEKARHEITFAERAANEQNADLSKLEQLEKTGKIDSPLKVRAYQNLGLEHKLSPETQQFFKIAQGFLRNAKAAFGSRVSNFELQQFQKIFPSLAQSPEGRKQIIDNIRRVNEAAKLRANTMRQIIKENKGRTPRNLEDLIEQQVGPQLQRLATELKSPIASSSGQQQLPDAAQNQGRKIRDTDTGQILQSNGNEWIPVQG